MSPTHPPSAFTLVVEFEIGSVSKSRDTPPKESSQRNVQSNTNNTNNSTNPGPQPSWSEGASPSHANPNHNSDAVRTSGISKATIGGSVAGGVIATALLFGLLWWLRRTRKAQKTRDKMYSQDTRNTRSHTKNLFEWVGGKGWQRKGRSTRNAEYAQDTKERVSIDIDDDPLQILSVLPTPATHLALPPPPPSAHLHRYQAHHAKPVVPEVSQDLESPGVPILPPRYWQIHNSPSAASLHQELSAHKQVGLMQAPAPPSSSADHGHDEHVFDTHSVLPPLMIHPPQAEPSEQVASVSPSASLSLSRSSSSDTHIPHFYPHDSHSAITRARILTDDPSDSHALELEPTSPTGSTGHSVSPTNNTSQESELTIRYLRHRVEALAAENARLSRESYVLLTRAAGEVMGTGESAPPAYIGDR